MRKCISNYPKLQQICTHILRSAATSNHPSLSLKSGKSDASKRGTNPPRNCTTQNLGYNFETIPSPFISFNLQPSAGSPDSRILAAKRRSALEIHPSKLSYPKHLHSSSRICNNGSPMREASPSPFFATLVMARLGSEGSEKSAQHLNKNSFRWRFHWQLLFRNQGSRTNSA